MAFPTSSRNSRKRNAPSVPSVPTGNVTQLYTPTDQVSNVDLMKWTHSPEGSMSPDSSRYNTNNHAKISTTKTMYDQSSQPLSTQLARRPINHELMQTGQSIYESLDQWGSFADETTLDPSNPNAPEEEHNSIEILEEKASIAKRDAQAKRKQIPPFVQKLSSFLEESRNTDLIRWSERGDSFVVLDEDEFAKTLIPELFKHNNYASFVRQLNMYGFHKRVGLSDNSMKASERKNKSPSEYYNPYFKRGHQNLLWLINKPKSGNAKNKKKSKDPETLHVESDDDKDVEEIFGNSTQNSRALSTGPESNSLQRRDVNVIHTQLAEIQLQQTAITNAIQRLRKDHNTLYQQSMAFQSLHDRHENSINAILSFLATVYNRSLDGQNTPNISQMFTNTIPHGEPQPAGNVVDIGGISNRQEQTPGSMSPRRKAQRLLMAPPPSKKWAGLASNFSNSLNGRNTPNPPNFAPSKTQPNTIDEVFETSRGGSRISQSPKSPPKAESTAQRQPPELMMALINNTNSAMNQAASSNTTELPDMLSHYKDAGQNSTLTSEQRNTMLSLMANSSAPGLNDGPISPPPPPSPFEDIRYTSKEIDDLLRLHIQQDTKINAVKDNLISPSSAGLITCNEESDYFNPDLSNSNLDLDQLLDTSAYFTGNNSITPGNPISQDYEGLDDGNFCLDMDGGVGIKLEFPESNDVGFLSPQTHEQVDDSFLVPDNVNISSTVENVSTPSSPSKRRRCN
ncbi:BgTH12-01285 [Blumeria graminis f. sp. triticale]|uniref:Bgt-3942 n=3 Tax=Blumeria graminis TaxID=34373 RepID=A0A381L1N8_BLUGR|nr:Trimeric heat shock transcription factor [Blumeria graminis f. sp. tritici 96224]CAD6505798.1 BgTH12-01285 [Blumeria graminis f. sp. triticale]VDB93970.1 Bgt-3942 [Blumeria graminis f. sp. tritici]